MPWEQTQISVSSGSCLQEHWNQDATQEAQQLTQSTDSRARLILLSCPVTQLGRQWQMRPSKGLEACVDVVFIFCQSASPSALFTPPCLCIFSAMFFCSFIIHLRLPSLSARPPRLATKSLNPLLRGVYQPCAVTQSSDRRVCHLHRVTGSLVHQTDCLAASAPISHTHAPEKTDTLFFSLTLETTLKKEVAEITSVFIEM